MVDPAPETVVDTAEALRLWLNFAASLGLTALMGAFLIFLFGRDNSFVYKMPGYKTLALKAGISLCTVGALMNAVTMERAEWSEVTLNVGLATLFGWAVWFHYAQFVKPWHAEQALAKAAPAPKTTRNKRKLQAAIKGK